MITHFGFNSRLPMPNPVDLLGLPVRSNHAVPAGGPLGYISFQAHVRPSFEIVSTKQNRRHPMPSQYPKFEPMYSQRRKPPTKAFSLSPMRHFGGRSVSFLAFPPPRTT